MGIQPRQPFTWGSLGVFIVLSLCGLLLGMLSMVLYQQSVGVGVALSASALRWNMAIPTVLIFLVPSVVWLRIYRVGLRSEWTRSGWAELGLSLLFLILVTPVVNLLMHWSMQVSFWPSSMLEYEQRSLALMRRVLEVDRFELVLVNLFVVALLPALGEELFFRGVLQRIALSRLRSEHLAIWLVAMIFSLAHFSATGFLARTLLGAMLGYLYFYTGSLFPSMLVHFVNNAVAVVVAYYSGYNLDSSFGAGWVGVVLALAGLVLSIFLVRHLARRRGKWQAGVAENQVK